MRQHSKKNGGQGSRILGQPTAFERAIERVIHQKLTIIQNGRPQQVSAFDAVLQKQAATALKGSPHAQRQFLANVQYVEERRLDALRVRLRIGVRLRG